MKLERGDWWILLVSLILAILLPWWAVLLLPFLPLLFILVLSRLFR